MKRILSAFMIVVMFCSVFAFTAMAEDPVIIFVEDFKNLETFVDRFALGAYYIEDEKLIGYSEARALQAIKYTQRTYDMEMTVAVAEDEMYSGIDRSFFMGYPNTNPQYEGRMDGTLWMAFHYDVIAKEFSFFVGGFSPYEEQVVHLAEPIPMELNTDTGTDFYTMGMSIDRGRIRCFFEGEMIFEYVDTNDEYLIGYATEEPYFVWNTGNCLIYDELKLGQVGAIYPYAVEEVTTAPIETDPVDGSTETTANGEGDTPSDNATTAPEDDATNVPGGDVTNAPAGDATNAPANDWGNTPEGDVADTVGTTGTQKPSTSTGDTTFAVVFAMVAAIGSALIVKKIRD